MTKNSKALSEQIYLEYKTKIYGYIRNKGVPIPDRDDVFSEIMLKLVRIEECYDSTKSSLSTWVYIVCRSVIVDYFRKRKTELPLTEALPSAINIEQETMYEEELSELAIKINHLKEREKKVIILRLYKDMQYIDIAKIMSLTEVNVRVIYSRAIKKLREWMNYACD